MREKGNRHILTVHGTRQKLPCCW